MTTPSPPLSPPRAVSGAAPGAASTTVPMAVVTLLFFLWGLLTSLNDVLIPHLKSVYTLSYLQAMLVQFCFFGAYLIVSLPAGMLIRRIGYQHGAVVGLAVAAGGCALFYPAAESGYGSFLCAFFILAAGITVLQVAANPYVTVLGAPATAPSRLNLTQAFNALGTTLAPAFGGFLILSATVLGADELARLPEGEQLAYRAQQAAAVQAPYLWLAGALLGLALLFALVRLPAIEPDGPDPAVAPGSLLRHKHLLWGAIGIFVYVGAEVSIGSFLINYMGEEQIAGLSPASASLYLTYYWGGAMVGRFIGALAMRRISPGLVLAFNSSLAIALLTFAIFGHGYGAMWALLAVGLCNSIMFPTIFSVALHRLGALTGQASGLLCMAIVGGAVVPFVQGALADAFGVQFSFVVPALCYAFVLYFGLKYAHLYAKAE